MNELMFYGGFVLSAVLFIVAVFLFFYFNVYSSIAFFAHRGKYVKTDKSIKRRVKPAKAVKTNVPEIEATELLVPSEDYTEILCDDEGTEILE